MSRLSGCKRGRKGTQNGVVTNENGRFSISVKDETAILEITYVGYKANRYLQHRLNISIVLESDNGNLSRHRSGGLWYSKEIDLTGSVSSVKVRP